MKCNALFTKIDDLADQYVDVWEAFASLESPTEYKEGVDAAGAYLAWIARELGFVVETFPMERAGDVVAITMNGDVEEAPVVFSGHMDTVHSVGSFGSPSVTRADGKLFGPGVADCKGGIVAALLAMHALRDVGFARRPVKLLLQSDEETNSIPSGGKTTEILVKEAEGAVAFLNCEATRGASAVMRRKGIVRFSFTVRGRSAHASKCFEGVSAIAEAAHKILAIEEFKDGDTVTCCCGTIAGGTTENTVPEECRFTVDVRFFTLEELARVRERMREVAEHSYVGGTCELAETSYRPAMRQTEENDALLRKMNEIYEKNGLPALVGRLSFGGSDASYTTDAGIPTVDSIGVDGDFVHTRREFAYIRSLTEAAKRLAAVAYCIE